MYLLNKIPQKLCLYKVITKHSELKHKVGSLIVIKPIYLLKVDVNSPKIIKTFRTI